MKSIQLLFLFCLLCVFIVPTLQYGTIFTDYLSTPVNFTDITEIYIVGIKSKTAYANTASVETISATNPDGFFVNSPGSFTGTASQNVDITSAQAVAFGSDTTQSTSLVSGGSLSSVNDRTDVNSDTLTFSTGDTLSFTSGGPLNIQGNNIDISSVGEGAFGGRDITIDSATYADVEAYGNLLLNATYHTSFITQYGSIEVYAYDQSVFDANFVNIKSDLGVNMHSNGNVNINAFAVLEMQAAQFAQVHAVSNITVNVANGDFDVSAAATVAIASDNDLTFTSLYDFNIYSFGDSESVVQLNARDGLLTLSSENSLKLGTFVNSYDVDLISAGGMASFSGFVTFIANNYASNIAGNDIVYDVTDEITLLGLDLTATSGDDTTINSVTTSVTLTTFGSIEGEARNVVFATVSDVDITAEEVSFLQGSPAILTRSEPDNLSILTNSITGTSITTQFDTIGQLIFSAATVSYSANTLNIRSSVGPHDVSFFSGNSTTISVGNDLKYRGSIIAISPRVNYDAAATTINFQSTTDQQNYVIANTDDLYFNAPATTFDSDATFTIDAVNSEANFIMTDSFTQTSYNTNIVSHGVATFNSLGEITVGAHEYINAESTFDSYFYSDATYIYATQTASLFAQSTSITAQNFSLNAGDTLYFTDNLPTDALIFSASIIDFFGSTTFESGRDLSVSASDEADFSGNGLIIAGYDSVSMDAYSFFVNSASTLSFHSDGYFESDSYTLSAVTGDTALFLAEGDAYISASTVSIHSDKSARQSGVDGVYADGYTVSILSTGGDSIEFSHDANFTSSSILTQTTTPAGTYTINTAYAHFYAPTNSFQSGSGMNFLSQTADIDGNSNTFTSMFNFDVTASDIWLLGASLSTQSDTVTFDIGKAGSFLSDDQITFSVTNGISLSSTSLNFKIPLDGTLHLEGGSTTLSGTGTSPFTLQSEGATSISSQGGATYTAKGHVIFDSYISTYAFTGTISLTTTAIAGTPSDISYYANEGEILYSAVDWNAHATTNSYLASRDINFTGLVEFQSLKFSKVDVDATPFVTVTNDKVGIWAESVHEDSHIVFDCQAGNINVNANLGSIYNGAFETQTYVAGQGYVSDATTGSTSFSVLGNHRLNTADQTYFSSTNDFSLDSQDFVYIESGGHITFTEVLANSVTGQNIFTISAGRNMLISTTGDGPLNVFSTNDLSYLTTQFQNWVVAHDANTVSTTTSYDSTLSDIVSLTSAGAISYSGFGTYTGTAGVNITFNSGHDSTFTGGAYTYTAGTDFVSRSIDGFTDFIGKTTTFTAIGGQLSIDSEGVRTVPRDGVFLTSADIEIVTSGGSSGVALYARRSVTFGEFTRPQVNFFGGGGPSQNGFTLNSDGGIKLTSESSTSFTAAFQAAITTSQAAIFSSGGAFAILAGTTASPVDSITISSNNGNVHFLSQHDSTWSTSNEFLSTATGSIQFTTLNSAIFNSKQSLKETANSLAYSLDKSYTSTSSQATAIDGHTSFSITTTEDSDVNFSGATDTFTTGTSFIINSYGDDAKVQVHAKNTLTISTTKSSSINFESGTSIISTSNNFAISAGQGYSVNSQSVLGEDPLLNGAISYISQKQLTVTANDNIDLSATEYVELVGDSSVSFTSTGDLKFNSDWDQEWAFSLLASSTFSFVSFGTVNNAGIVMKNSPGQGGDITITSPGIQDVILFRTVQDFITLRIGNNFISHATDGLQIITRKSDFKDAYGIRFQTDGTSADLEFASSASLSFTALVNNKFDASNNLNVYGGIGVSLVAQGVNFLNQGVIFGASTGDISFTASQSPISFVGDQIEVYGNGTDTDNGRVSLIANGIDKSSSYGIRMEFDASVLAFGTIAGNIDVSAGESIEINLNGLGAHALFGYQRNTFEELFSVFKYLPYEPYDPTKQINVPLQSRTSLISSGTNADIVFETQKTQDGIGQFIAYAGTIEPYQFSELNAPSQLQLVSYGNGDVTGDISFTLEGGITIVGLDRLYRTTNPINNPIVESDCLFLSNDESSSIVISTTKEAIFSNIELNAPELNLNAENKLNIRSLRRNGDSTILIESGLYNSNTLGKIAVTTTGSSWGPGTALPGIELRSYRSNIDIDAGLYGDVIHHSLRNMAIEADQGIDFSSRGGIFITGGTFTATSSAGDFVIDYFDVTINPTTSATFGTYINYVSDVGEDVILRSPTIEFTGTNLFVQSEGSVYFNFDSLALIETTSVTVKGNLAIPMIDDNIATGDPCVGPGLTNVQNIFIARSPPYVRKANTLYPSQYDVFNQDIYQTGGLRLCSCGNPKGAGYVYECIPLDDFY